MERGGILALDLSTHTGWAYGLPGKRPLSGVWHLPSGVSIAVRGDALIDKLSDIIKGMGPKLIVCEAPVPHVKNGMASIRSQLALSFVVDLVGHWFDVRVKEESVDDVRRSMLGRCRFGGREQSKAAVMAWVRERQPDINDDNRADAFVLWHHACALHQKGKVTL